MRSPRYYRANACTIGHHYDEYGRCSVCHSPDPAVRRDLAKNLAALAPEAGINPKSLVTFGYRDANDFIGRNAESFCADFITIVKLAYNFFTQIFEKAGELV